MTTPYDVDGPGRALTAGPGDIVRGGPGRIGDPPPVLTWRYHRGDPDGTLRVVRAHGCDIEGGRVTWRDWHGAIVLSEPSTHVHHLACEQADGTADDRPAYAGELRPGEVVSLTCPWCAEAARRGVDVGANMESDGHLHNCPRIPGRR